jgi:hypothetical protein
MNYRSISICATLFVATTLLSAQNKLTMTGKCGKADTDQSVPAADMPGHNYAISAGKCTAEGKVGSANAKEGAYAENQDIRGNVMKNWGTYAVTLDDGDKIFMDYQGTDTMKGNQLASGNNRWTITGGTGKMKGAKGVGQCKLAPAGSTDITYTCNGTYGMPGAKQ